jgi:hypothetical protein
VGVRVNTGVAEAAGVRDSEGVTGNLVGSAVALETVGEVFAGFLLDSTIPATIAPAAMATASRARTTISVTLSLLTPWDSIPGVYVGRMYRDNLVDRGYLRIRYGRADSS